MLALSRRMRNSCVCNTIYSIPVCVGGAVVQCDAPSDAQVAEVHARFVAALIALFDAHKHLMGPAWAKRTLEIV